MTMIGTDLLFCGTNFNFGSFPTSKILIFNFPTTHSSFTGYYEMVGHCQNEHGIYCVIYFSEFIFLLFMQKVSFI